MVYPPADNGDSIRDRLVKRRIFLPATAAPDLSTLADG
jgi:hypothetical protein